MPVRPQRKKKLLKCLRCKHEWEQRTKGHLPLFCPWCKRDDWKTPWPPGEEPEAEAGAA